MSCLAVYSDLQIGDEPYFGTAIISKFNFIFSILIIILQLVSIHQTSCQTFYTIFLKKIVYLSIVYSISGSETYRLVQQSN